MTIALAIAVSIILGFIIPYLVDAMKGQLSSRPAKKAIAAGPKLSAPAKRLIKEYNELPKDNRPFPDIKSLVQGLDERTSLDADARDEHFAQRMFSSSSTSFSWVPYNYRTYDKGCSHRSCKYKGYYDLHVAIEEVKRSVEVKERALREAETAHTLDEVAEFTARLRDEAKINNQVAEGLK